jgi:hypothetical protein
MIKMRRAQLSFGDGLIADEVKDLYEDWMKHVDEVLGDEALVQRSTRLWRSDVPIAVTEVG